MGAAGEVVWFDYGGNRLEALPANGAATSAVRLGERVAIVYDTGVLEILASHHGDADRISTLLLDEAVFPLHMELGPAGTLIVAFQSGHVGLWETETLALLDMVKLHGEPVHIQRRDHQLYLATDLGDHTVWDLSSYERDYCDLLAEVWDEIPVVWEGGQTVRQPPPPGHRCNDSRE